MALLWVCQAAQLPFAVNPWSIPQMGAEVTQMLRGQRPLWPDVERGLDGLVPNPLGYHPLARSCRAGQGGQDNSCCWASLFLLWGRLVFRALPPLWPRLRAIKFCIINSQPLRTCSQPARPYPLTSWAFVPGPPCTIAGPPTAPTDAGCLAGT